MAFIDEKTANQVRTALEALERDVELLVYTASSLVVPGRDEPGEQRATLELLNEVVTLSGAAGARRATAVGRRGTATRNRARAYPGAARKGQRAAQHPFPGVARRL
jgi:hypothetical protein